MEEKAFNLLDEPWILATSTQGESMVLSLTEIFDQAHKLKALSGEMPGQDVAILRLLLGVLYSAVIQTEEYQQAQEDEDNLLVLTLWKEIWNKKCFAVEEISAYLNKYHDRFYLIHPETPFWQVKFDSLPVNKNGITLRPVTYDNTVRCIGDYSDFFCSRFDNENLSFSEAARWLVFQNAFEVAPVGNPGKNPRRVNGFGNPWPAKTGLLWPNGNNLFETLVLNLVLLHNKEPWPKSEAWWEQKPPCRTARDLERTIVAVPESIVELMTMQHHYIRLLRDGDRISGYEFWSGVKFSESPGFVYAEQMTAWTQDKEDNWIPRKHSMSKQIWRDFAALMPKASNEHNPGVLDWLCYLQNNNIPLPPLQLNAFGITYKEMGAPVDEMLSDSLMLNAGLISALGEDWVIKISARLGDTEKMVDRLGRFAANIAMAIGDSDGKSKRNAAREEAYYRLDMPFRAWLANIDPLLHEPEETSKGWLYTARDILLEFGKELISQAGTRAFIGREVGQEKKFRYSAPEAHLRFRRDISKVLKERPVYE